MSANFELLQTTVIVTPHEKLLGSEYDQLPLHVNVVDPFVVSEKQTARLTAKLAIPLLRGTFEVTGFEHEDRGLERVQRLGGSVLHGLHDEIIDLMDELRITHNNVQWTEGSPETWYSGTWHVPDRRTTIGTVYLAQESPDNSKWSILRTYKLDTPSTDYRQDPLYIDSLIRPVQKRGA